MTSVLLHILSWPAFLTVLLAFGFAPGLVLRIIVLAFNRSDPRRQELIAELYNVPRLERPFWVADQAEVALNEVLIPRLLKIVKRWNLGHRLARGWRNFWHDDPGDHTLATQFSACALFGSGIYLYMLLPGVSKYIALIPWFALLETNAFCRQRYRKRRKRDKEPIYTPPLDMVILAALGPAVYVTTGYMLIHNLIMLITGNLMPGYWIGGFICILVLLYPQQLIRETRWAARQENKPVPEQANTPH